MTIDSLVASSVEVNFTAKEGNPFWIFVNLNELKRVLATIEKKQGSLIQGCSVCVNPVGKDPIVHVPSSLFKGLDLFLSPDSVDAVIQVTGEIDAVVEQGFLNQFYSIEYSFCSDVLWVKPRFSERKFLLHLKELADQSR